MTTGQLLFYAGIGLFGLTVILAIVFLIKKPKYRPENAAVGGSGETTPLRNGYPTEPMTVRYSPVDQTHVVANGQFTEVIASSEGTAPLGVETATLANETVLLSAETELLLPETQLLNDG